MQTLTLLIPAITTIAGAMIGAAVSYFVSRYQFRAMVLSGNRQNWINDLRDTLAEWEAIVYDTFSEFRIGGPLKSTEDSLDAFRRANLLVTRVKFLLNPTEEDHAELLDIMGKMSDRATRAEDERPSHEFSQLDSSFVSLTQAILKREWERVKVGR